MYFENDLFSEQENNVIKLLMQGKSNKQIALELRISNRTVEFHLSNIYTKLSVRSRSEAILKFTDSQLRKSTGDYQVISTVDNSRDSVENGLKFISRRITMKKPYYVIAGLSAAVLLLVLVIVKLPTKNNVEYVPTPLNQAIATNNNAPLPSKTSQAPTETLPTQLTTNQQSDIAIPPHTVNGYTATIESYYVDTSRIIFLVRLTGGERVFGDKYFYGRFDGINLYDEYGNMLNASHGVAPAVDPALYLFTFEPVTLLKGNHIKGQFAFDVNNAPEEEKILAKFRFDFDLPIISPDLRFYPKQTAIANNLEVLLDSVTVTPSFTQIYLCFPPITYAPWTIGHQSMLKIDGQEAYPILFSELFNSELGGNLSARSEPYWTSPIKNGRCLKSLFPIGSSNPTSLTLTIPQLENLIPYANDEYFQIPSLYPGLSPKQAFYTYLEENNYTYKGPWVFTVELTP